MKNDETDIHESSKYFLIVLIDIISVFFEFKNLFIRNLNVTLSQILKYCLPMHKIYNFIKINFVFSEYFA